MFSQKLILLPIQSSARNTGKHTLKAPRVLRYTRMLQLLCTRLKTKNEKRDMFFSLQKTSKDDNIFSYQILRH